MQTIATPVTTKTTNGATAYFTKYLANDIEGTSEIKGLISLIGELFTATGMQHTTLVQKSREISDLINKLEIDSDRDNFLTLILSFIMYKRDPRHGSGRRDESRAILFTFCEIYQNNRQLVKLLLKYYFNQGYWGDAKKILEICNDKELNSRYLVNLDSNNLVPLLQNLTCELIVEQLDRDYTIIKSGNQDVHISPCAKWCVMPKKKKGKTGKDRVAIAITLARYIFPNIKQNEFYYAHVDGQLDTSKKLPVNDKTPDYFKWCNLLSAYRGYIKKYRVLIPYVEKFMRRDKFSVINHSALTGTNKLRYVTALRNELPRYLKGHTNTKIPKKQIEFMRSKYGETKRFESEDRVRCAENLDDYQKSLQELQKQKLEKMNELKEKIKDATSENSIKLQEELLALQETKTTNFNANLPIDVYRAYSDLGSTSSDPTLESCIMELITGKLANLANIPVLCVADTSGSMYSCYRSGPKEYLPIPIEVCISMTSFFAMTAPNLWKNKFIQFSDTSYIVDMENIYGSDPTFFDYIKYMKEHQVNAGSTNFESVLGVLEQLLSGEPSSVLPKYLIIFSDMQFNQAVRVNYTNLPAAKQLKHLFVEKLGYSEDDIPKIVFWNLASNDNRPATLSEENVVMLSGFNPQMLLDLDTMIENPLSVEESNALANEYKLEQEKLRQINTWNNIIFTLSSSPACVEFLKELSNIVNHNLLD